MKYLFVLGRDKSLGILEVISFLKARRLTYKIVYSEKKFLILELDKFNFSVEEFGGIIKIGRETSLDKIVIDKNKITYSVYGDKVLNELKKKFKEEKVKAMFRKYSDEPNKNDLGLDIEYISNMLSSILINSKSFLFGSSEYFLNIAFTFSSLNFFFN